MVMLSTLRHFHLRDAAGRRARVTDFSVGAMDGDYPAVSRLLFRGPDRGLRSVPGESIRKVALRDGCLDVDDLEQAEPADAEVLAGEVLLRRDVLDALVLDLQNRRATRANDLWLLPEDGTLRLMAADTSARAVLRRVSRGHFGSKPTRALYDWKYVEFLRGNPQAAKRYPGSGLRIGRLPPGEIATLSALLPYLHAAELLTLLPDAQAADVLEATEPTRQLQVFEELSEAHALRLLAVMAPDAAADLVGTLVTDLARRFLERLPAHRRERIVELLRYPPDTIGGVMTNDFASVPLTLTVAEARLLLRERLREPDFAYLVYVVESEESRRLAGVVSLRVLLVADEDARIADVMNPYVAALAPLAPALEAAHRLLDTHLAAMPVVNRSGELIGVVTVDAALSRVAPAGWSTRGPRVFS